jgi:hypothetical protein
VPNALPLTLLVDWDHRCDAERLIRRTCMTRVPFRIPSIRRGMVSAVCRLSVLCWKNQVQSYPTCYADHSLPTTSSKRVSYGAESRSRIASEALRTPGSPWLSTWVCMIVGWTSFCPKICWSVRINDQNRKGAADGRQSSIRTIGAGGRPEQPSFLENWRRSGRAGIYRRAIVVARRPFGYGE